MSALTRVCMRRGRTLRHNAVPSASHLLYRCRYVPRCIASPSPVAAERPLGIGRARRRPRSPAGTSTCGRTGRGFRPAGLGEGGRRGLHGQVRRLPWRVRRRAPGAGRRSRAATARSPRTIPVKTVGSYFALSVDGVRLYAPCHAVRRRAVADRTTSFMPSSPTCCSSTTSSTKIRAVAGEFGDREDAERRRLSTTTTARAPKRRSEIRRPA